MKFEVSGAQYEIDLSPERLMGDEVMLLDERLASDWASRWARLDLSVTDIVMLTYLAAKRAGDGRSLDEFAKTIAPLTFKPVEIDDPEPAAAVAVSGPADAIGPMVRGQRKGRTKAAS